MLKSVEDNKLTTVGVTLLNTNQYDHMGRLIRVLHKTNAQTEVVLADYKYTDLGTKVSEKNLYSTNGGTSYLQSVDYTFNEKGWLTNINKTDLSNGGDLNNDANDIFGMEFKYYKSLEIDNTKAVYNGNISEVIWRSTSANKKQGYLHTYDDLNRLTSATYRNFTSPAEHNQYNVGSITYDANGNIKTLQQNGLITGTTTFGLMDNLTYAYNGNRLSKITDAVSATSYPNDFQNGSNPAIEVDYNYDENGNLTFDDNKGISGITYNLLNLPEQITLSNGKKTIFTYDAFGTKLKKQEYTGTTLDKTYDYLGSVQYLNGTSQFASTGEGRVYNNSGTFRYDYFMKDQVGNIRLTYTANGSSVNILQRDEYYPFGNTFGSYLGSGGANTYKFNGMEYQENGLNTIDFHARMYDPQIGRTFQPDPMADMFAVKSPYAFLANNPVMYTDPTGMSEVPADDFNEGEVFGPVSPGGSTESGSWFINSGKSFRGAGGFYAAFNPRGQWRAEKARFERSFVVSWVERYKEWYFRSEYTGTHYTNTTFEGRYLVLNEGLGDLSNQYLEGVQFLGTTSNEFTNLGRGASKYCQGTNLFKDWFIGKARRERLVAGPTFFVNSGPEKSMAGTVYLKCLTYLYVHNTMAREENAKWFEKAKDKKQLPTDRLYFQFLTGGTSGKNEIHYGSIPASARPVWWPQ